MGMFDDITCKYPLPLEGANALDFQTKDTPVQFMDRYEIREDGTLWHEEYDTEDLSPRGIWERDNPGKELPPELDGIESFIGCMSRTNKRWERETWTGEVVFYTDDKRHKWVEFSAYFVDGKLAHPIQQIKP